MDRRQVGIKQHDTKKTRERGGLSLSLEERWKWRGAQAVVSVCQRAEGLCRWVRWLGSVMKLHHIQANPPSDTRDSVCTRLFSKCCVDVLLVGTVS